LIRTYNWSESVWGSDVLAKNDTIYYTSISDGLIILRYIEGVGIEEISISTESYALLAAYPNPFNAVTTISVEGPPDADIAVFDISGRQVATLKAHDGKVVWDAEGLSSGLYFARASNGTGQSNTIKLICIK